MAIKDYSNGDVLPATDLEADFYTTKMFQIYSSTALDVTVSAGTGAGTITDANAYEMSAITATNLGNCDYLEIDIIGISYCFFNVATNDGGYGVIQLKIETKEIGGSYSDSLANVEVHRMSCNTGADGGENNYNRIPFNYPHFHTLTAGEKTNGVQVQITISAVANSNSSGNAGSTFTNKSVIIRGGAL